MSLESAQKFFRLHGIACILLVFAGCGPPVKKPANVLLVVVDTLRQDHLGVYGYSVHPTSPHLDQFAQESFTMHGLTGVSSWTMPSVATLFTGLTPKEHGVMRMVGEESRLLRGQTLAERFSEAGFQTACIQSNFLLRSQRGVRFDRGFHHWDDSPAATPDPHRGSSAKVVADKGLEWLEQTSAESPWFLTLHFFDPHSSYEDHEELHFEHSDYQGWVTGGASNDVLREHGASSTPKDRNQLAAYYDEEIRAVDEQFGRLLASLKKRDDWENTLVVFTSDHGEELAERGYIGHTRTLHFEQTNLPLMIRLPGGALAGSSMDSVRSQTKLCGTILELAGVSAKNLESFHQEVLGEPLARDFVPIEVDFVPVRQDQPEKRVLQRGFVTDEWRYIANLKTGEEKLFQTQLDEHELNNLVDDPEVSSVLADFRERLQNAPWWESHEG